MLTSVLLSMQKGKLTNIVTDSIEQALAHIFRSETEIPRGSIQIRRRFRGCMRKLVVTIRKPAVIFRLAFRLTLHSIHFAETTCNCRALEAYLAVIRAVDIAHQHVNRRIVSPLSHAQHLFEIAGSCEERKETPKSTTAEGRATYALELSWAGHFDHGDAGADVDEEVGVGVRVCGDEFHGIGFTVGEDFARDFGDKKVQACFNIIEISICPLQILRSWRKRRCTHQ